MSKFIELTLPNGTKTFVNVNKIDTILTFIRSDNGKTRITFNNDYIEVTESYETVKDLINK